jgi:hypothetical protein
MSADRSVVTFLAVPTDSLQVVEWMIFSFVDKGIIVILID